MAKGSADSKEDKPKRTIVRQSDIPAHSLDEALRIPRAILENYAGKATEPFKIAKTTSLAPNSPRFRMITGAATAYGLTDGGYKLDKINITSLARRILTPTSSTDELEARREAFLKPRVINDFLLHYNHSQLPPRPEAAYDVLVDLGVPEERTESVYETIIEASNSLGFIENINGKKYVSLELSVGEDDDSYYNTDELDEEVNDSNDVLPEPETVQEFAGSTSNSQATVPQKVSQDENKRRRVFITHGKNQAFLEPIRKLLAFGELEAVVSVRHQSVSEPVPDKILNEMRSCGAAIIHVDAEEKLLDQSANEHVIVNPNVLIEIGASMALYGRRFILLVKEGIKLPSNLQGLYEVRYSGEMLDGETTIKLLEAINEMKKVEVVP